MDEYDAPLLDVLHNHGILERMRNVMQELYQPLKANEAFIKFCFITGITRLSQLSIFSTLNNLTNILLNEEFSTICGITEQEVHERMKEDVNMLAKKFSCSDNEMFLRLKRRYDGYHFSEEYPEVYNPYSLMSAFANRRIANYWFETGTPTFLIRMMKHFGFNITDVDNVETTDYAINRPTEAMTSMTPLLYLTIKGYDPETEIYTLSIPNQEVRIGYTDGLLPAYTGLEGEDVQTGFAMKFWKSLKKGDINLAMQHIQAYLAGLPYIEGFKKKLAEAATGKGFYEYTLYLIFSMLNVYVRTQVKVANGRADMVVSMPDTIYVFEFKVGASPMAALKQIDDKGDALPYKAGGKNIVKVGVSFNNETRTIDDRVIE